MRPKKRSLWGLLFSPAPERAGSQPARPTRAEYVAAYEQTAKTQDWAELNEMYKVAMASAPAIVSGATAKL